MVSTFFIYTGRYDAAPGRPKSHNEVDIEFVWRRREQKLAMQSNWFAPGSNKRNEHYTFLPFDAEKRYHNYAFKFTSKKIEWYADGVKRYTARRGIPDMSGGPYKIMMNTWVVGTKGEGWAGKFVFQGKKEAVYKRVRFTRGEDCVVRK